MWSPLGSGQKECSLSWNDRQAAKFSAQHAILQHQEE
jgi:hypothetical protein